MPRHFLSLFDFSPRELLAVIERSIDLKSKTDQVQENHSAKGQVLAMIFELSSTRTRVAFEAGMHQLGGSSIFLNPTDTQLGRGEPIEDTAKVLSRMVDIVMIRAREHETVQTFAENSSVPVINGMSNLLHPCQLLADIQTYVENRGAIAGKKVAFLGDGYNMCNTYIEASVQFDFELHVATPTGYSPTFACSSHHRQPYMSDRPREVVSDADLVVTDVWASMGHEHDDERREAFDGFQVTSELLDLANDDCLFFHCLPAHRGEEVDENVLDDPRSLVWEEAGNRMHSQKALIEFLLNS